jgi:predicted nuclease of predicted toxin-antitoxin system
MNFLIDECLHTSLAETAESCGHQASHVLWLGLGGHADWRLMTRIVGADLTFVTNNARDFRKLFARQSLHAGLVILLPQVSPAKQRELFRRVLADLGPGDQLVNEVIEIGIVGGEFEIARYDLPKGLV